MKKLSLIVCILLSHGVFASQECLQNNEPVLTHDYLLNLKNQLMPNGRRLRSKGKVLEKEEIEKIQKKIAKIKKYLKQNHKKSRMNYRLNEEYKSLDADKKIDEDIIAIWEELNMYEERTRSLDPEELKKFKKELLKVYGINAKSYNKKIKNLKVKYPKKSGESKAFQERLIPE